jgi:hypothetical protein
VFSKRKRKPTPPDEDTVVDRVLCLSAVAMLGTIAAGVEDGTMDETPAAQYLVESHRWLIRENLANALSGHERALIAKPLSEWTPRELADASRRNESMGVLLWALSALDDVPPYDASFERLPAFVPLLAVTSDFRNTARLRSPEELERARGVAELWHWRVRTRQLEERDGAESEGDDLDAIIREAATTAFAKGSIPPPIEDDFPVHGKPFRALDADEYADVASSALERHYALNWLAGRASDWDEVPTDS